MNRLKQQDRAGPKSGQKSGQKSGRKTLRWVVGLIAVALLFDLVTFLIAEGVWFSAVGYGSVLAKRLWVQGLIGLVVFTISFGVLSWNVQRATEQAWPAQFGRAEAGRAEAGRAEAGRTDLSGQPERRLPGQMTIWRLLPLAILGCFTIAASLFYYAKVASSRWLPNLSLQNANLPVPLKFSSQVLWDLIQDWQAQPWQLGIIAGLTVALLIYPQVLLRATTALVSLGFVLVLSEHWDKLLLGFHQLPFNTSEPLLQKDVGFYIFALPVWELLEFWLLGLAIQAALSVGVIYLLSADSLSQGNFPGFSATQSRHLCGLGGWLLLAVGFSDWIDRYALLYSPDGAAYGASYTSATVELPIYTALSLLALPLAFWLLGQALASQTQSGLSVAVAPQRRTTILRRYWSSGSKSVTRSGPPALPVWLWGLGLYGLATILLGGVLPPLIQQFVVQPNEIQLERPYIERTLALTRKGFNLDQIEVETFDPDNNLDAAALQRNNLTVENIRLWDRRPLLETNRQLERIRLYYEFPDADIDRYRLPTDDGRTIQQQVLIAARELDYQNVPDAARTWVNQHLVYTHGYGFTVSPVNVAREGGLPDYLIRGIESTESDPLVQSAIPIGKPRIYYGEITNNYVMTQTRVPELDYPSGSDNVYNRYEGWGGVSLGNFGQRLLYAKYLKDWRMLFTDNFTPQTRLLFRRNINERVKTIAPFLRYDTNPYLVVVNTGDKQWQHRAAQTRRPPNAAPDESHLYWIIDAYTTSDRYPYSDPLNNDFNYIRNSVKVVIDAYHGAVTFYIADLQDPLIQAWAKIFPTMFKPLAELPTALSQHLRYPQDFFQVQSNQLMTYHMTDPTVFYNREDQWRAPNEIYGSEQQVVEPYYLIMKLPVGTSEEFILLRPFTPAQRNNLIAWVAARSDRNQYGKMLLYTFPKQELVFGPEQIEARINQDPVISERISLWNRQGSRAAQGNLLVIPIERSLLYVEPLYLEAEQNQLPTLVRVIVVYGGRIAIAETLEAALKAVFAAPTPPEAPILRPAGEAQ
jgi:uncharacterized protein